MSNDNTPFHQVLEEAANSDGFHVERTDEVATIETTIDSARRYNGPSGLGQAVRTLAKVLAGPDAVVHVHKRMDRITIKIFEKEAPDE